MFLFFKKVDVVSLGLNLYPLLLTGKKFGVGELGTDVINFISHAAQQRLQNLLAKVSQVAQHRNITFKVSVNNSHFSVGQTRCLF